MFAFSTEHLTEDEEAEACGGKAGEAGKAGPGWLLRRTGRFAHARWYVEATARDHGFIVAHHDTAVGREDAGKPIVVGVYVLRKGV